MRGRFRRRPSSVRVGRLFGTAVGGEQPEIFVLDPVKQTFEHRIEPPEGRPLDLGLQVGPDGFIYGFTSSCFYRIKPSNLEIKVILREDNGFDIAGPILGNSVYFGDGHLLKAIRIFE